MISIRLRELLNNPDDSRWRDLGNKILSNSPEQIVIIDCDGVNPDELGEKHRYDLFYLTQQKHWGFGKYTQVFQNTTDEMADFLNDVIESKVIIVNPIVTPSATTAILPTPPEGGNNGSDTSHPDTLPSGTLVGHRYEIEKELGGGSFGETYLAKDTHQPGQPSCVVKRLRPSVSEEGTISKAKQLFEQEAKVLSKLEHKCIPKLFAYFEENGRFYLVQDYIEGDPLDKIIPGQQPLCKTYSNLLNQVKKT